MELLKTDVCVVGAGPGGSVTAMFLAKAGINCILLDKAKFPRDKVCGDALSGKVVEVLKKLDPTLIEYLNKEEHQVGSWGVTFVAPNLKELRVPFRKDTSKDSLPPGFLSKRMDFDNFLIEQVKKHKGITLIEECEINNYEKSASGWLLKSKDNQYTIQTKLIISADGAHSYFARHIAGIEVEPAHYCAGIRAYYKNVKGLDRENFIELHFLKDLLPGYFWIFPLANGYANVGVGMRSDKVSKKKLNLKNEMLRIIEKYPQLKSRFADAELIGDIKGYGLPLGSKQRKLSGDGYMLVGDSGALIDPFTGEGIGNAMTSGMLAAESAQVCITQNDFSAAITAKYHAVVYNKLWSELKISYKMQQLVNVPWLFKRGEKQNFKRNHLLYV
jgi:menaquinone-9 beta-reductase